MKTKKTTKTAAKKSTPKQQTGAIKASAPAADAQDASKRAKRSEGTPGTNGKPATKGAKILALIQRPGGATASELQQATGWQPHSVRGFLSGVVGKRMGIKLAATRGENGTTYTIA